MVMSEVLQKQGSLSQGDSAVKEVNKKQSQKRPGRLAGTISFEIHTADAQQLFSGYGKEKTTGLLEFGAVMGKIWDAAGRDDPYADWFLLKIYDAVVKLRNQLAVVIQDYQQKIHQVYGREHLQLTPFLSQQPVIKQLWFRTQYGYLGANVIADFDELMRTVLTANRVGVLLGKTHEDIREHYAVLIRSLFSLPSKWQDLSITREVISQSIEQAKKAKKLMGELPDKVLTKSLRSPFSPAINVNEI